MIRYSKKEITFTSSQGNTYTANKLSPFNTMAECAKVTTFISTGIGAGADAYFNKVSYERLGLTLTSLSTMLHENLDEEHLMSLQSKLFGSLKFNNTAITDEHFEDEEYFGDFLEVWIWLFKENIVNFILSSGMIQSKIKPFLAEMSPKLKEDLEKLWNELKLDTKEKPSDT